jgi:glycopeptide antibiotics resistance protein
MGDGSGRGGGGPGSLPLGALAWFYLVVLWLTWTPVGASDPEVLWSPSLSWTVVLGNLLLFAPLAFVLGVHRAERMKERQRGLAVGVAAVVALLSIAVELGQTQVPGRHVSPWDLALNTGGAALAALVAGRSVQAGIHPRALVSAAMGVVFVGVLVFLTATGFTASRMLVLSDWDERYSVEAGAEPSGARMYWGSVSEARVCAGRPESEVCAAPGASLDRRLRVSRRAHGSQSVRLSAVVTSHGLQPEAARVVTFSADPYHRNATLVQEGRDLLLRLRTPRGGPNGTGLEFLLPEAVSEGVPTMVAGSFWGDRVEIEAQGPSRGVRAEFVIGFFSGWWLVRPLPDNRVRAGALLGAILIAAAAFSLPFGLGAVGVLPWGSVGVRFLVGGLAAPLVVLLLASVLQIPFSARDLGMSCGFGLVGVTLGFIRLPGRMVVRGRSGARNDSGG